MEKRSPYYATYGPSSGEDDRSTMVGRRRGWLEALFGCCECSVVAIRISLTVMLVITTCILSIFCSAMDIANDGEDTASFLFWFFVFATVFFCCDTCLIAFLCVKGLPCIPSNQVISYSLLPFYLVVQAIFVIFMFIQVAINFAQWLYQQWPQNRGKVPLGLDIFHIVVNVIVLFFFLLCLLCLGGTFIVSMIGLIAKKGYDFYQRRERERMLSDSQLGMPTETNPELDHAGLSMDNEAEELENNTMYGGSVNVQIDPEDSSSDV